MVRYESMALYQFKEFLDFDDVADYLMDKGIYHFDLYQSDDRYRLSKFIWGLIISDKITPVFYYSGFAYDLSDKQNQEFLNNKTQCKEMLIFSDSMLNDWNDDRRLTIDGFSQKPQAWGNTSPFQTPFNQTTQEYVDLRGKTSDFYKYKSFKNNKEYILDISNYNSCPNLLIPRIQLDNILFPSDIYQKSKETSQAFDKFGTPSIISVQPSIETLNQRIKGKDNEIATLNARIAELERQVKETGLTIKGIDLVNYERQKAQEFACIIAKSIWKMDKTRQIKTGEMVQYVKSLLLEFSPNDVPERDETLSDWLKEIKPQYATTSGRPPKNTPTEIPLTFKK